VYTRNLFPYENIQPFNEAIMIMKALNPTEIFAQNLSRLRKMQGLSQEELADRTDLTRQTVSKYEKGEADPSISMLNKFAEALDAPVEYFFKENNSKFDDFTYGFKIVDVSRTLTNIKYREYEKLDDSTNDTVKREAFVKLSKLLEVEKILGSEKKFKNPINNFQDVNTKEKAEQAALEVRKKWALYDNPFANVISVLEREGVKIIEVTADTTFEGLSAEYMDLPIIVLNDAIHEVTRKRFTALHELGHLILQIPDDLNYEKIERICDAFAAMLILPKELLILELGNSRTNLSLRELNLIKQKYGISIRAILVSAGFAGVISWKKYREMCDHVDGASEEIREYQKPEVALRFRQLLYRGVMTKKIDMKRFVDLGGDENVFHELTNDL
jgi:transcriptional regulator with XRE-family HTH domain